MSPNENYDPVDSSADPATTTVDLESPDPTVMDGGRLVVGNGRLIWDPDRGGNVTVETPVPIRVSAPIRVVERLRLRLTYVRNGGTPVVRVDPVPSPRGRPRVETGCRGQRDP